MIIADDKRPKEPPDTSGDLWSGWQPLWTGKKRTPHDLQEKHSPTETVTVRLTAERRIHQSQRRMTDARLWDGLSATQQEAAIEITTAFDMMGRGMGYVLSNWERLPGCNGQSNVSEAHGRLMNLYINWAKECAREKISHSMVADVICFGFSCRMIDRDRRLKNGATRKNLIRGLQLYCDLSGWTR